MGARGPVSKAAQGRGTLGHRTKAQKQRTAGLVGLRGGGDGSPVSEGRPASAELGDQGAQAWRAALASCPWLQSEADLGLVRVWADLHDERAELRSLIAEHGRTTTGSQGQVVEHPFVGQLGRCEAAMLRTAAVLGVGPMNAGRLGVPLPKPVEREDPDAPVAAAMASYRRAVVSDA